MDVTVLSHLDPANDTVVLVLDLVGATPFQHEFLKAVFASELSTSADEKDNPHGKSLGPDDLRIRLPFTTKGAFEAASKAVAPDELPAAEAAS